MRRRGFIVGIKELGAANPILLPERRIKLMMDEDVDGFRRECTVALTPRRIGLLTDKVEDYLHRTAGVPYGYLCLPAWCHEQTEPEAA